MLPAANGGEAIALLERDDLVVDLLLRDLVGAVEAALQPGPQMVDSIPATKTDVGAEGDDGQVFGG